MSLKMPVYVTFARDLLCCTIIKSSLVVVVALVNIVQLNVKPKIGNQVSIRNSVVALENNKLFILLTWIGSVALFVSFVLTNSSNILLIP
jgi:hypothetical protein